MSAGHARTLITSDNPEALAKQIVEGGLSVRNAEALNAEAAGRKPARTATQPKDADTRALEEELSNRLGLTVTIDHKGNGGTVKVQYKSLDQLDGVVYLLKGGQH